MDATAVPDTLEKWQAHLERKVERPEVLTPEALAALSEREKARYDHARLVYLGSEHVLRTRDWYDTEEMLQRLRDQNLGHRPTARQALLVSGPQRSGKSTIALNLLRKIDRDVRLREGREGDRDFAPTVPVVAPNQSTPRKLWERFAFFLNIPHSPRDNAEVLAQKVLMVLADLGTEVILLDEVQNLRTSSEEGTLAASALKGFMERLPVTWMFCGVNAVNAKGEQMIFTGKMGRQMRGRIVPREMTRYGITSTADREEWKGLITAAERLLPLVNHRPGSLAQSSWDWLHDHTGGSPGPLWDILHSASTRAIRDGSETVSASHLSERWLSAADRDHVKALSAQGAAIRRAPRTRATDSAQVAEVKDEAG